MVPRRAERITGLVEDEGPDALALHDHCGRSPPAGPRQRDAGASKELRRPFEHQRRAAPRHERRRRAEPLHAVDQPLLRDLQQAGVHGLRAGRRHDALPNSSVCGTQNGGDPVILYDQFANRWFATQSAYANLVDGPYYQCVAVSRTATRQRLVLVPVPLAPNKFTDHAKFGVWPSQNAYMMTSPQYYRAASFSGIGVWALERNQLLSCGNAPDRVSRHGLAGS